MSECTRCGADVVYPHDVQQGRQWRRLCDDCFEYVVEENTRDLIESEYEEAV